MEQYRKVLQKYIPASTDEIIMQWLQSHRIHLHVSKSRVTKLGDFRPPAKGQPYKITVNYNLNQYAFLITLVHEIAHVEVWQEYKNRVKPHGLEWKQSFSGMMSTFLEKDLFPPDVEKALKKYVRKPLASSGADIPLARALKQYDKDQGSTLEELPADAVFSIHNGKRFKKLEKSRKRYRCLCMDNNRIYMVHPMTNVVLEME